MIIVVLVNAGRMTMILIDADALNDTVEKSIAKFGEVFSEDLITGLRVCVYIAMQQPTQPEIIHCRDCKWSDWYDAADGHRYCYCIETGAAGRTADDFCSYAECEEVSE